jgi:hypothetical protein
MNKNLRLKKNKEIKIRSKDHMWLVYPMFMYI